jgi:hypothetical protein
MYLVCLKYNTATHEYPQSSLLQMSHNCQRWRNFKVMPHPQSSRTSMRANSANLLNYRKPLKKAFDTIEHEILPGKLNRYGFSNQTVELFRNYLSGRTQITVINNISSGSCEITCGVPQGSILGPLLFLLYINDIPKCQLVSNGRLFADDTNLTYAGWWPQ